ncbi:MAG: hypothetical protein IT423_03030 [Pirellulaceae bacterium]|nr:hypothetical protein [Pirellulaceae bacterium]
MRILLKSTQVWLVIASLMAWSESDGYLIGRLQAQSQRIGQLPKVNYLHDADSPPGAVSAGRLMSRAAVAGYFQPVEVTGPERLEVALAQSGQFLEPLAAPVKVGMLVGAVYRLRVTNIPLRPGEELYPTIEVLDRLYAPRGREHRFPVPIVLEKEDLWRALDGGMVTRVIYLEDSDNASPAADEPGSQRVLDVGGQDNALKVADQFGRPMAILRIGSRVPTDLRGDLSAFLYNSPPWMPLTPVPTKQGLVDAGLMADVELEESEVSAKQLRRQAIPNEPRLPAPAAR